MLVNIINLLMQPNHRFYHIPFCSNFSIALKKSTACAKLLLEHGANPDARDIADLTPLMMAVKRKAVEIVELIVARGNLDLELTDPEGNTALHYACQVSDTLATAILKSNAANGSLHSIRNKLGQR